MDALYTSLSPVLFNLAPENAVRNIPDLKEMEIIGHYTLFTYVDYIILLGEINNMLRKM